MLSVTVRYPGEGKHEYRVRTIKLSHYGLDEIFQKRLFFLLPFYFLKYEKSKARVNSSAEERSKLMDEIQCIVDRLEEVFSDDKNTAADIVKLMIKVTGYIFEDYSEIRKEIVTMGGKVLELESERNLRIGRERGLAEGRAEGREEATSNILRAIEMKRRGNSPAVIQFETGLSKEIIERL